MTKVLLLIPCYNEANRIDFTALEEGREICKRNGIELSYLFANDGSSDTTKEILDAHCSQSLDMAYHLEKNAGKGNALQTTYQESRNLIDYSSYSWIGFWDADLATPLDEIPKMIKYLDFYNSEISAVFGSRVSRLGSNITRDLHRHYLGRIFVTIVSNLLNVKAYDSQCGAKLFTPSAAELAFKTPFISRWIFDVEILLRLKGHSLIEFPLFVWTDVPGSKVKVFKEILRVGKDLLEIRKTYLRSL